MMIRIDTTSKKIESLFSELHFVGYPLRKNPVDCTLITKRRNFKRSLSSLVHN